MQSSKVMITFAVALAMMVGVALADQWCSNFNYDQFFSTWNNQAECNDCCRHYLALHNGGYISNMECYCNDS